MFQHSLIESHHRLASPTRRWIAASSIALQTLAAAAIVALPLLHPEALTFRTLAPAVVVPPLRKLPIPVAATHAAGPSSSFAPPAEPAPTHAAILPTLRPADSPVPTEPGMASPFALPGTGPGIADLIGGTFAVPTRRIVPTPLRAPLTISSGISSGMLLAPIRPIYPRIAIAAHIEGTVILEATISRTGAIESAHILSGPAMLASAALDAARAARYRPYLLNGEPTEVRTTITVNFRIGSS